MSIYSAMLAGVSGLSANSSALAAISDNIANVNTVGYKRNANNFSTLVTSISNSAYSAGGVHSVTHQYNSQQGLLQSSTSSTDLAISGNGFFVTTEKPEDLTPTDARSFTRAGSFTVDKFGYLKNAANLYLQGWPADSDGVVTTDPSDISQLKSINVSSFGGSAEATTRMAVDANLKSSTPVSTAVSTMPAAGSYNAATNNMTMYSNDPTTGVKPDFEIQVPLADSKGGARTMMVSFMKSATPNIWYAEMHVVPAADVVVPAGQTPGLIRTGVVTFTQDGRLDETSTLPAGMTRLIDPTTPSIVFGSSNAGAPAAGAVNWAASLGIDTQTVKVDFGAGAGGLTQYDSQSVVQAVTTNGTAFGNLTNIEIDATGDVTAIFDNGTTRRIAQVAIATFPNPDGLRSINGNAYRVSLDSGTYNFKQPGTGGAGFIAPSSLEASTVDLSLEFTGLITTQRAYSASSKIITTADQMLEELINIKR
jgi:flagellar hook protein FlgE